MVSPQVRRVTAAPLYRLYGNVLCVVCARPAAAFWPGAFVTHTGMPGCRCIVDGRRTRSLDDQAQAAAQAQIGVAA